MNIQSIRSALAVHKKWFIVAGIIVMAIVVSMIIAALTRQQSAPGTRPSVKTYGREGFGTLAGSVADPAALSGNGYEKPVTYEGRVVIDACNLLPINQLNREKVRLFPNPVGNTFERYFISGDGTGRDVKRGLALGNELNECEYIFNDSNSLSMNIWQPGYLDTSYAKYDLAKYVPADSPQPDVTHKIQNKAGGTISHLLQKGDVYAEFSFISAVNKDKAALDSLTNKLMPYIMQNFAKQVGTPSGAPKYMYDSPTFTRSVAFACSLIHADSFQNVFKMQPSPVIHEKVTSTVGLISGFQDTGDQYFHYIQNECERRSGDSSYYSEQKRLRAIVTSYEDPKGAKGAFDFGKPTDKGADTPRTYGDASYVVTVSYKSDPGTVMIRKGRFIIKVTMSDPSHESSKTDPTYFVNQLDPALDNVVLRLPQE